MKTSVDFLTCFFDFLNKNGEYAVLRNYEGLPKENSSRDIDIILEYKTYKLLKKDLIDLINSKEWKIITYLKSDRLITWVCGFVDKDCNTETIQLDFFFHTSVYGIYLLEAKEVLRDRVFNGAVYHVSKEYEFLDKYMYDRAVGAQYPDKYFNTKNAVIGNKKVYSILECFFGEKDITKCDKASSKGMLQHALKYNFTKRPISTIYHILKFEYYRILNYICSNTGFSIGFTGPDGSGKTTVINLMTEKLGGVFNKAHTYFHFRPMLFGNIGDVAQSAGLKKDVDREYDKPHRGNKTNILSSLLRLLYYSTDYVLGYFIKIKSITRITRLAIFDRYYTDIICDSKRTRIYLSTKLLYWFGRLFIPSLDYNILLTASTNTILSRKRELDKKGIEDINAKIDYLSTKKGYKKIMNDRTPETTVSEILEYIFECQHKKNLKRLK